MRNPKQRRRAGFIATVLALVALAVPAFASGATYSGTLAGGGTLSFKTVNRAGQIARVKDFAWKGVPARCDQGAYDYTAALPFGLVVKSNVFGITATGGGIVQAVSGRLTDHRRTASGHLNVYGDLASGHTSCSTGRLSWSATRR